MEFQFKLSINTQVFIMDMNHHYNSMGEKLHHYALQKTLQVSKLPKFGVILHSTASIYSHA